MPANSGEARDAVLTPGLGRFPGEAKGNPLQYSCLGNSMERGALWITVHGVAKNQKRLSIHTRINVEAKSTTEAN